MEPQIELLPRHRPSLISNISSQTRRVLRELESDMLALRSFKNQKDAELLELRKHERQLQDALEEVGRAVSGGNAKLAQQQQGLVQQLRAIQVGVETEVNPNGDPKGCMAIPAMHDWDELQPKPMRAVLGAHDVWFLPP